MRGALFSREMGEIGFVLYWFVGVDGVDEGGKGGVNGGAKGSTMGGGPKGLQRWCESCRKGARRL